jgi:chromosome segregation ATPase
MAKSDSEKTPSELLEEVNRLPGDEGDDGSELPSDGPGNDPPEDETDEEREAREAEEAAAAAKAAKDPTAEQLADLKRANEELRGKLEQIGGDLDAAKNKGRISPQEQLTRMMTHKEKLEGDLDDAIMDGKKDDAKRLRKELSAVQDYIVDFKTILRSDDARSRATDDSRYDTALSALEAKYPQLDEASSQFDQALTDEIADIAAGLSARHPKHVALKKAADLVLKARGVSAVVADDGKNRSRLARERAIAAVGKQPPKTNGVGRDVSGDDTKPRMPRNVDDLAKMDEKTLAILRGDVLK